ncbi:MAG: hypothetical protein IT324_26345 [Anaerolineae bacterium]|nr:hypothetical protein [Anaerolineae bacterium]
MQVMGAHMTDRPDGSTNPANQSAVEPGFANDEDIPVEELVRQARELTARITNEDRQRLSQELSETGHHRSIQTSAPFLLQQFFTGKIDLDVELARRFPTPPLLATTTFAPDPGKHARHGFAHFASQDNAAAMLIELHNGVALEMSFLLQNMIGVRFTLGAIQEHYRRRFLELMRRPSGIAFLWTHERWESDYLIFVLRERFARVYAFGPGRFDAACRLTPDGIDQLITWLAGLWAIDAPPPPTPEPPSEDLNDLW